MAYTSGKEIIQAVINVRCKEKNLPLNPLVNEISSLKEFPKKNSKTLAILILTYKREALNSELAKISSHPAGIIRSLLRKSTVLTGTQLGEVTNLQFKTNSTRPKEKKQSTQMKAQ